MTTGRLLRDIQNGELRTVPRDRADVLAEMLEHAYELGDTKLIAMLRAMKEREKTA